MKIVREHINEKFVEDSDPVTDMGIGTRVQISRWMKETFRKGIYDNALVRCAQYGKLEWVKFLLATGADVHKDSENALVFASDNGHIEVVKELLKAGADVRVMSRYDIAQIDKKGFKDVANFLRKYRKEEIKESLLEKFVEDSDPVTDMGIGVRAQISRWMKEIGQEDTDSNALAECAEKGKLEWVKFLIATGANVHYSKDYALRWASYQRHLEVVKELLKAGANVHAVDDWALTRASNKGYLEVVKELLKAGADVHADNDCALRWARDAGHQDVVDFLEDYITNEKKLKSKVVKESLLEKFVEDSDPVTDMGIGIRAQISRWMKEIGQEDIDSNALAECADQGKLEWVKFLIAAGADVHFEKDRALRWASYEGHLEVVKELIKAGANVHAYDDYALRLASQNGYLDVVKELLKAGADVHINNDYALRTASDEGHLDVVKELLKAGANVHAKNKESIIPTALIAAKKAGHQEIVDFLEDYIANEKKPKRRAVKESLLEKFVEDSDPIHDMGMGLTPIKLAHLIDAELQPIINKYVDLADEAAIELGFNDVQSYYNSLFSDDMKYSEPKNDRVQAIEDEAYQRIEFFIRNDFMEKYRVTLKDSTSSQVITRIIIEGNFEGMSAREYFEAIAAEFL